MVVSKCWGTWHGREPPAENEKAFKRLREKVRNYACIGQRQDLVYSYMIISVAG